MGKIFEIRILINILSLIYTGKNLNYYFMLKNNICQKLKEIDSIRVILK